MAIGTGWADGAWIDAAWIGEAWDDNAFVAPVLDGVSVDAKFCPIVEANVYFLQGNGPGLYLEDNTGSVLDEDGFIVIYERIDAATGVRFIEVSTTTVKFNGS